MVLTRLAAFTVLVVASACEGQAVAPRESSTATTQGEGTSSSSSSTGAVELRQRAGRHLRQTDRAAAGDQPPKTCNTCHLSGVDLQMFVRETPCQTMACLDARGLVDLADPTRSVVLQWIAHADPAARSLARR